jgi:CBS domain-containing protein
MKVKECMQPNPIVISSESTIKQAAQIMLSSDIGILPVHKDKSATELVGVITDRDIATRAVAKGLPPDTKVEEVMTPQVIKISAEATVERALELMSDNRIRRLIVCAENSQECQGVVSLTDMACGKPQEQIALSAMKAICRPDSTF